MDEITRTCKKALKREESERGRQEGIENLLRVDVFSYDNKESRIFFYSFFVSGKELDIEGRYGTETRRNLFMRSFLTNLSTRGNVRKMKDCE